MPFVTGRFYVFDLANDPHGIVTAVGTSLADAQNIVDGPSGRLKYDRSAGQRFHLEIHERTASGFTRHNVYQSS